ncbi:MAG: V-type ATP synthase subunit F [Eubacteriales bacterium]
MYRIGVIGDKDSVMGFKALGLDVFYTSDDDVGKTVNMLAAKKYAIVFMTEDAVLQAKETVEKYKTSPFPAIIPIPNNQGTNGLGMEGIRQNVEKAIGADILFNNEE